MTNMLLAAVLVLAVIFTVPFVVYGTLSALGALEPPAGASPAVFLLSVLVMKIGTAIGFVAVLQMAWGSLRGRWLAYSALWWAMFVISEIGQAIGPGYTAIEAVAGVISETIYFPIAGLLAQRVLARGDNAARAGAV